MKKHEKKSLGNKTKNDQLRKTREAMKNQNERDDEREGERKKKIKMKNKNKKHCKK